MSTNRERHSIAVMAADAAVIAAVTVFATPYCLLIGPIAALLLHRERIDRAWILSMVAGLVAAVVVGAAAVGSVMAAGALRGQDPRGGIAVLLVSGAGVAALFLLADVDALRDLISGRRAHVALDVVRLAATVVVVVGSVGIAMLQSANPASEIGDVAAFAVLFGLGAGIAMAVAATVHERLSVSATGGSEPPEACNRLGVG